MSKKPAKHLSKPNAPPDGPPIAADHKHKLEFLRQQAAQQRQALAEGQKVLLALERIAFGLVHSPSGMFNPAFLDEVISALEVKLGDRATLEQDYFIQRLRDMS